MINKYGLYRNIIPRKEMGQNSTNYDDQTTGYWLPFFKNEELFLVDTYHIQSGNVLNGKGSTTEFIKNFIKRNEKNEDSSWIINRANFDYYYFGSIKIDEYTEKFFEEICDLRQVELCRNVCDYDEENVFIGIQLWNEHGYPGGVDFKLKNAVLNKDKKILNEVSRMMNDNFYHSQIRNITTLKTYLKDTEFSENTKKRIEISIELLEKLAKAEYIKIEARKVYNEKLKNI